MRPNIDLFYSAEANRGRLANAYSQVPVPLFYNEANRKVPTCPKDRYCASYSLPSSVLNSATPTTMTHFRSAPITPGIAFITGGARGLGNAIAVSFAKDGPPPDLSLSLSHPCSSYPAPADKVCLKEPKASRSSTSKTKRPSRRGKPASRSMAPSVLLYTPT